MLFVVYPLPDLAATNPLVFYKVVEHCSRMDSTINEIALMAKLLVYPGLLSGELYQQLLPSWKHSKAFMSALASCIKGLIRVVCSKGGEGERGQEGEGGMWQGKEGPERLDDKGAVAFGEQMDEAGVEGMPAVLGLVLSWLASEADPMGGFLAGLSLSDSTGLSLSNSSGPLSLSDSAFVTGFMGPEQLGTPRGIQLVVLLWSARGLAAVGRVLLGVTSKQVTLEHTSCGSISNSSSGMGSSSTTSSSSSSGGMGSSSTTSSSSSEVGSSTKAAYSSSRGHVGSGTSGCTSSRLWQSDFRKMFVDASLWLTLCIGQWQLAAADGGAAAGAGEGELGSCLELLSPASGAAFSSSNEGLLELTSSAAAAGVAADWSSATAEVAPTSSSTASGPSVSSFDVPKTSGQIPKRLSRLPRGSLPAAVVNELTHMKSKWALKDYKQHLEVNLEAYFGEGMSEDELMQFVADAIKLAEVLLAEVHTPLGCSNPRCANLAGESEVLIASKSCSRCKVVWYCSRNCQTAHWDAHKRLCKQLRKQQEVPRQEQQQ